MSDSISRQAAIKKIPGQPPEPHYPSWYAEQIKELPSAEPEPIKINIEDFNKEDWERLKKEWGNTPITVLPAQPEIVRCKDCDWWTKQEDSLQGRCALLQMYPTGGWFCGNARRREVTT